ncbi:hypothetical protein LTR15_010941 [Elasticomyces elasticus]|nr:hypothetical protein LTR15_010941 [Elasticomyces elasticus]
MDQFAWRTLNKPTDIGLQELGLRPRALKDSGTWRAMYFYRRGKDAVYTGGTSVKNLIRKLEIEAGTMARVTFLEVEMQDVLLPTDEERDMVKDI